MGHSVEGLDARCVSTGMLPIFATVVAIGGNGVRNVNPPIRISGALAWRNLPTMSAQGEPALGSLIAVRIPCSLIRTVAHVLQALGVLRVRSGHAALASSLLAYLLFSPTRRVSARLIESGPHVATTIAAAGLAPAVGFVSICYLFNPTSNLAPSPNFVYGTQSPKAGWWFDHRASVTACKKPVTGQQLSVNRFTKESQEVCLRQE